MPSVKRKRSPRSSSSTSSDLPSGWKMTTQSSGGKIYTHKLHGKVRSLAAVKRLENGDNKRPKKATKSTKKKQKKATKKAAAPEIKGSPHVGAKGVADGETYCVVHKSHNVTVKRLLLDDAIAQGNTAGWSEARIKAFAKRKTVAGQNAYYYRFNAPGEQQRNGKWEEYEKLNFLKRRKELGGCDGQWGLFALGVPGRVGYQCSNFYRKLIENREVEDPNYALDENGKARYLKVKGGNSRSKNKGKRTGNVTLGISGMSSPMINGNSPLKYIPTTAPPPKVIKATGKHWHGVWLYNGVTANRRRYNVGDVAWVRYEKKMNTTSKISTPSSAVSSSSSSVTPAKKTTSSSSKKKASEKLPKSSKKPTKKSKMPKGVMSLDDIDGTDVRDVKDILGSSSTRVGGASRSLYHLPPPTPVFAYPMEILRILKFPDEEASSSSSTTSSSSSSSGENDKREETTKWRVEVQGRRLYTVEQLKEIPTMSDVFSNKTFHENEIIDSLLEIKVNATELIGVCPIKYTRAAKKPPKKRGNQKSKKDEPPPAPLTASQKAAAKRKLNERHVRYCVDDTLTNIVYCVDAKGVKLSKSIIRKNLGDIVAKKKRKIHRQEWQVHQEKVKKKAKREEEEYAAAAAAAANDAATGLSSSSFSASSSGESAYEIARKKRIQENQAILASITKGSPSKLSEKLN
jgi:hypothetical protein